MIQGIGNEHQIHHVETVSVSYNDFTDNLSSPLRPAFTTMHITATRRSADGKELESVNTVFYLPHKARPIIHCDSPITHYNHGNTI